MDKFIFKLLLILIIVLASQIPGVSFADTDSEYKIKAAFIYNLARFTQWPNDTDDLNICIYGEDPFGSNIDNLNGKQANDKTIKVLRIQLIENVKRCHIVFLNIVPPERYLFEKVLMHTKETNVLTVADAAHAIDFGVMIRLIIDNDKVAFEVNHSAAKASDLEISAKLLRLAKAVI